MPFSVTITAETVDELVTKTLRVSALACTWQVEQSQKYELEQSGLEITWSEPEEEPVEEEVPEEE